MADDVKVRLSAEGVQDVVDAMKRIRDESKAIGEEGSKSITALKDAFHEFGAEIIGFVAIGALVEKTRELITEVFNLAQTIGKLHDATGLSVESLQALSQIAEDASVSQETLNKGLGIFTRTVGQAEEGSKKASQGFSQLGISVKDLKNLSPDQQFELVAKKLAGIDDASRRAAVGAQIFGKSFLEMQPVIEEVANGGMESTIEQMRRMGTLMDDDVIKQMQEAKKALHDVGDEAKGLATQFLVGLMPAVSKAMDEIVKDTEGGGVNAFKTLGEWVGKVIELIVTGFRIAGATVGYVAAQIENAANHGKDALKDLGTGALNALKNSVPGGMFIPNFKAKTSPEYQAGKDAISQSFQDQLGQIMADYNKGPELPKTEKKHGDGSGGGVDANDEAIGKARLAFIEAQLQAELALYNAQSKLREESDKEAYEAGKLSLENYFKDRADILNGRFDKELQILQARRQAVAAQPIDLNDNGSGGLQKRAELAKLDGDIAAKQVERQTALAALRTEERQAQQKNYEDQLSAEQKLLTIEGRRSDAARLQLQLETQRLELQLRKSGASQSEITGAVGDFRTQGENKIQFDDVRQDADATLSSLNTQIKAIQDQVRSGALFPVQAEQQIIDLEKQRIPVLQQLADEMVDLANKTKTPGNPLGDPQMIAQAESFKEKVNEIALATDEAGQQMAALKQTAQDSLQNGVAKLLTDLSTGTDTVGNSFRKMAFDIASSLVQLEAKFLANQFVKWLMGGGQQQAGQTGSATQGMLSRIGSAIAGLFGGGNNAAASATQTANTTAVTANTAAQTASATAQSTAVGAITALTAAVTANTAAVSASAAGSAADSSASWISMIGSAAADSGYADGGHVRGAGTATSDSIPAMLSDGEFIVNAAAAQRPGMLALLHAINGTPGYTRAPAMGVRRYAEGGAVAGGGMTVQHYHVDASQVPQHIVQQAVDNAIAQSIARQPVKIRSSLG